MPLGIQSRRTELSIYILRPKIITKDGHAVNICGRGAICSLCLTEKRCKTICFIYDVKGQVLLKKKKKDINEDKSYEAS